MKNTIYNLPKELVYYLLDYHPYFFKYKREYTKTILVNDLFHRDSVIEKEDYFLLRQKYKIAYTDVYLYKKYIVYTIMICFESNIFNDIEETYQELIDNQI